MQHQVLAALSDTQNAQNAEFSCPAESPARSEPRRSAYIRSKDASKGSASARCYVAWTVLKKTLKRVHFFTVKEERDGLVIRREKLKE